MTIKQPFAPRYGGTQTLTANSGSQTATIDPMRLNKQLRILNTGANIAQIRTSDTRNGAAVAATAADYPIAPGQATTITFDQQHDALTYISATGTTLVITPGEGF